MKIKKVDIPNIIKEEIELNEKFIGNNVGFVSSYGGGIRPINDKDDWRYSEIYENPGTLKNFGDCRAVLDDSINLFIADNPNVIHLDLIDWLQQHGFLRKDQGWEYPTYVGIVALQQYQNTNILYLSESYEEVKNFTRQDLLKKARIKFPFFTFKEQLYGR